MPLDPHITELLKTVIDPELGIDIVSLGLIYKATQNDDGTVAVRYTLTTPGCPLAPVIDQMIREALVPVVADAEEDITLELTFDPPWVPSMMSEEAQAELEI